MTLELSDEKAALLGEIVLRFFGKEIKPKKRYQTKLGKMSALGVGHFIVDTVDRTFDLTDWDIAGIKTQMAKEDEN